MANVTLTQGFIHPGSPAPVSRGGAYIARKIGLINLNAAYATGGDTIPLPDLDGGVLLAVVVLNGERGANMYAWDGSTSTPKIKAFTAAGAEVAASTNNAAVQLVVELIFKVGT
jgi:hypothetical protein